METDLEIYFVEHVLDAMMKRAPVGFSYILGTQYMTDNVFSFSVILKPRSLVYSVFSSITVSHHNFY